VYIRDSLREGLEHIDSWDSESILQAMKSVLEKHKVKMPVLYHLLTGAEKGLPLPEVVVILGKREVVARLT
jgi:glutamyl/glutaminyl-tRNA synthetase